LSTTTWTSIIEITFLFCYITLPESRPMQVLEEAPAYGDKKG